MIVGSIILFVFILGMVLLYNILYNDGFKKSMADINEYSVYLKKLEEDKTRFLKRIGDTVYIEYGIEKFIIITIANDKFESIFALKDDKTDTHTSQHSGFLFNYINKTILLKTFVKYNDKIFNTKEYGGSVVDSKTYDLMEYMVELTKESVINKKNKQINDQNNVKFKHFDIDEILDRINKVGYEKLSDEEKDFLRKQK